MADLVALPTLDGSWTAWDPETEECFHARMGALVEAQELYVQRSGLRAALRGGKMVAVLDVGLGLGYNALSTIENWWRGDGAGPITIVSLEHRADLFEHLVSGSGAWMEGWSESWRSWCLALNSSGEAMIPHRNGVTHCHWRVALGDAIDTIRTFSDKDFDFIWQDPFSPNKNPRLWTVDWFDALRQCSSKGCTLATYSVARSVRDNLAAAGWAAQKIPAAQGKRSWLLATLDGSVPAKPKTRDYTQHQSKHD